MSDRHKTFYNYGLFINYNVLKSNKTKGEYLFFITNVSNL